MCKHTRELTLKRNAVVCLRQGLSDAGISIMKDIFRTVVNEELARHENYYDSLIDRWEEECPVCFEIDYSDRQYPAAWDEIEQRYEERVCEDLETWGKSRRFNV